MKIRSFASRFTSSLTCAASALLLLALAPAAQAANSFWDTDGNTTGAATNGVNGSDGTTAPGTWGVDSFWSTSSTGNVATTAWTANDLAIFSASTDATGAYTVAVSGPQTIAGITFEEGTVTLSGGTLALGGLGNHNITTNTSRTATIDSAITSNGSTGFITKAGAGTLILTGGLTLSGNGAAAGTTSRSLLVTGGTLRLSGTNNLTGSPTDGTETGFYGDSIVAKFSGSTLELASNDPISGGAIFFTGSNTIRAFGGARALQNRVYVFKTSTLTIDGTDNLTFNGQVVFGLGTTADSTALTVNNAGITTLAGGVDLTDGGRTKTINGSGAVVINSSIIAAGTAQATSWTKDNKLTYSGTGSLKLAGTNYYSGDTTVSQGTLLLAGDALRAQKTNGKFTGATGDNFATVDSATGLEVGMTMDGITQLPPGTTITNISGNTITFSNALTGSLSALTIRAGHAGVLGWSGNGNRRVLLGSGTANNNASLLTDGSRTIEYDVSAVANTGLNTNILTLGGSTAHTSTFGGSIILGTIMGTTALANRQNVAQDLTLTAVNGGTVNISGEIRRVTGTVDLANVGAADITKTGLGTVIFSRAAGNSYDGTTTVSQGTLRATNTSGSATGSGAVTVNGAATLTGSGLITGNVTVNGTISGTLTTGQLSGSGLVTPGNSAGIETATQVDPTGGLDFAIELGQIGSPNYGTPLTSGNDVLRLTDASPFLAALTGANTVTVTFLSTPVLNSIYRGAFYSDLANFSASIASADFQYTGLAAGQSILVSVVMDTADFDGAGPNPAIDGFVTQFQVVPEPSTIVMLLSGMGMLIGFRRFRRS